jgi:hypothetical protein
MTPERRPLPGALALIFGVSCAMSTPPAATQNLVANGDFDDVQQDAGWSLLSPPPAGLEWLAADRDLCPQSGDLHLYVPPIQRSAFGSYTGYAWSDCIVLPAGVTHLELSFDWTDNSSTTAGVVTFPDPGCADEPSPVLASAAGSDGSWNRFESGFNVASPPSIRVEIGFLTAEFASLIFDRVYIGVRPAIFLDGFEGGSPCRWVFSTS